MWTGLNLAGRADATNTRQDSNRIKRFFGRSGTLLLQQGSPGENDIFIFPPIDIPVFNSEIFEAVKRKIFQVISFDVFVEKRQKMEHRLNMPCTIRKKQEDIEAIMMTASHKH